MLGGGGGGGLDRRDKRLPPTGPRLMLPAPPRPVRKPVLYFHLDEGTDALDLRVGVSATGGHVVEHFPAGILSDEGAALSWPQVHLTRGACRGTYPSRADPACQTPDGLCEAAEIAAYESATADCIQVGAQRGGVLLYRTGPSTAGLPLAVTVDDAGQLTVRRVAGGQGSAVLFDVLAPGAEVGLDGPYGVAYLRPDAPRDLVCVAGGSGLAPMISIARGAVEAGMLANRRLHFFYGAREPRDVCGEPMLAALAGFGERIDYCPVVSSPGVEGWAGATGFVHTRLPQALSAPLADYEFYFAGPPPMTQALQEMLMVEHRVPFEQIHFDRFF